MTYETRGFEVGKVANDRYWPRTVVMYVLSLSKFACYIFPFLLTPAELISDDITYRQSAGNVTLLIMHKYIGATNHLAPMYVLVLQTL